MAFGHVGLPEAFDGTNLWISEGNYTLSNGDNGYIHIYRTYISGIKVMYPDVVFAVPEWFCVGKFVAIRFKFIFYEQKKTNITNTSVDDSKVNVKKLKYKKIQKKKHHLL